jgi:hypothetical protein
MSDGNVWLEQRLAEGRSLAAIITALEAAENGQAVRGAGVSGRASQPTEGDSSGAAR